MSEAINPATQNRHRKEVPSLHPETIFNDHDLFVSPETREIEESVLARIEEYRQNCTESSIVSNWSSEPSNPFEFRLPGNSWPRIHEDMTLKNISEEALKSAKLVHQYYTGHVASGNIDSPVNLRLLCAMLEIGIEDQTDNPNLNNNEGDASLVQDRSCPSGYRIQLYPWSDEMIEHFKEAPPQDKEIAKTAARRLFIGHELGHWMRPRGSTNHGHSETPQEETFCDIFGYGLANFGVCESARNYSKTLIRKYLGNLQNRIRH